jgi:hypothetical protein
VELEGLEAVIENKIIKKSRSSSTVRFVYVEGNETGNDIISTRTTTEVTHYSIIKDESASQMFDSKNYSITFIQYSVSVVNASGEVISTENNNQMFVTYNKTTQVVDLGSLSSDDELTNSGSHHQGVVDLISSYKKEYGVSPLQDKAADNERFDNFASKTSIAAGTLSGIAFALQFIGKSGSRIPYINTASVVLGLIGTGLSAAIELNESSNPEDIIIKIKSNDKE